MKRIAAVFVSCVCLYSPATAAMILTAAGDPIAGFWGSDVGQDSNLSAPGNGEGLTGGDGAPAGAIDGDVNTKYFNFGTGGGSSVTAPGKGVGTGFYVTPSVGSSVLTGVQVTTANYNPNVGTTEESRDPLTISVEGSNGGDLTLGSSWTLIADDIDLGVGSVGPGQVGALVAIPNSTFYTSYRVIVQSKKNLAQAQNLGTQYAEMTLFGTLVPEPSSAVSIGMATLALLARRRVR